MREQREGKPWKCFEYGCPLFPKCATAAGSCAIDEFFEDVTLSKEQCLLTPDKPFYKPKQTYRRK